VTEPPAVVPGVRNERAQPPPAAARSELVDLTVWLTGTLVGLALTFLAVQGGARLGTRGAPFLGLYRFAASPASLLAPMVLVAVLVAAHNGWFHQLDPHALLIASYLATLAWAFALALADGEAGLTRSLMSPSNYLSDVPAVGDHPLDYLRTYVATAATHTDAARGHPPGPVLLLWTLQRLGLTDRLVLGVLVTAIGGLLTPLVLGAVRSVCGEPAARGYAPVLILAPYAVWVAVSVDVVGAVLGAAMVCLGVRASRPGRTGLRAAGWALGCGVLLGIAALCSYAVPWLGLSVVCLYFARRRAFLNLATGIGALMPILAAQLAGFSWVDGLGVARRDYAVRIEPTRPALWWSLVSLVVLLLAAGPPLVASLRKLRNTPGWPFLVGAGVAVAFTLAAGLARGGAEAAWLTFFPWLTVAAVAPERPAGPPVPPPLLLTTVGAITAIVVETVLATPW
jgi:methylthioxylose transferase